MLFTESLIYAEPYFPVSTWSTLYSRLCVPCDMAADIYRYRQPCYMSGCFLDIYRKAGLCSAEALRPYAELVYLIEHSLFKVSVQWLRVSD